ncbi:alpha/beta fold hydrolase [Cryobacterium sp. BB736]|uniref:alpha/beta fold hydrolase n=1 Tax=Cryobacterium sp. BB736 TaxID=2746963 RepID=UPI00187723E9|nr:alpha/beta hydrolase [Cryobacterium sp. BB736]
MNPIGTALNAVGRLSPTLAARIAFPLFMRVGPRLPVRADAAATHEAAVRDTITVNGKRVTTYQWGQGTETVLLVHGWRGRAAQFARLVRELRASGFTVVSFDAPANGASGGRRTSILDYLDAIEQLQRKHGSFHTVVGHSMGTLATLVAIHRGLTVGRLVGISGVAEADNLYDGFRRALRLRPEIAAALPELFRSRVVRDDSGVELFSSVRAPLTADIRMLLIHDRGDRMVPVEQSERLAAAHPRAQLIVTEGLGHGRILVADETLDAVMEFVTSGERVASS